MIQIEDSLTEREGDVFSNCVRGGAAGDAQVKAGAGGVARLGIGPFVTEDRRYAWLEVGERQVLQKIESIDALGDVSVAVLEYLLFAGDQGV